jgi:hypothetical protein
MAALPFASVVSVWMVLTWAVKDGVESSSGIFMPSADDENGLINPTHWVASVATTGEAFTVLPPPRGAAVDILSLRCVDCFFFFAIVNFVMSIASVM